jgi:hypothetical protein
LIAFGPATEWNPHLENAEFFSLIEWDPAAPKRLRRSAQSGDWQGALRLLTAPPGVLSLPRGLNLTDRKLALWSLYDLDCPPRASRLLIAWQGFKPLRSKFRRAIGTNGRKPRGAATQEGAAGSIQELAAACDEWLSGASPIDPIQSIELLLLFEILREAGANLPVDLAARLWRTALEASIRQLSGADLAASRAAPQAIENRRQTAFEAELAWEAGLLFAAVAGSAQLREQGRATLSSLLADSSDSSGIPVAHSLSDLPAWMTSVVRAREWGRMFGRPLLTPSQESRLRQILTSIAKFCRADGRPALTNCAANGLSRVWSTAAATFPPRLQQGSPAVAYLLALGRTEPAPSARIRTNGRNGSLRNGVSHKRKSPVFQSDSSRLACLRSNWTQAADSILVSHCGRFPRLEMAVGERPLLAGDWELELNIDGQAVEPGNWNCVCWHSDHDGDYLELQTSLVDVRVERQIFLSRNDGFALLADAVRADVSSKVEFTSRVALAPGCGAAAQTRTRECRLVSDGVAARAFPLALNCPRVEGTAGRLSPSEGQIELSTTGAGGLYAPLVLDWNPSRRRTPVTWRRLTVASGGAAVQPSEAAGFLLEAGSSKWLFYRSLARALEPRSILGQHTMYETLVGRFVRGDVEPIIQIEQAAESSQ